MTRNYFFSQIVLFSSNNLFAQDYYKQFHLKYLSTSQQLLEGIRLKVFKIPTDWNPRLFTMTSSAGSPMVFGNCPTGEHPIQIRDGVSIPNKFLENIVCIISANQKFYMDRKAPYKIRPYHQPSKTYNAASKLSNTPSHFYSSLDQVSPIQYIYISVNDYYLSKAREIKTSVFFNGSKSYTATALSEQQPIRGKNYYSFVFEHATTELLHNTSFFIDVEIEGYYYNHHWELNDSSNGWNQAEEFNYKINLNTTKNYFTI